MKSAWQSPSNIAIVKYWGKKGFQIPANPSISFTLDQIFTQTELYIKRKKSTQTIDLTFFFDDKPKPEFIPKITQFLSAISNDFPWLNLYHLEIHSKNNFPYGTGIASSASAMSALALCIIEIDNKLSNKILSEHDFMRKSSFYSRIGSGSACRSIYRGFSEWGYHSEINGSSDEYAIPLTNIHPDFMHIMDSVLLIENTEKSVSSSKGHDMLNEHWYASRRFEQGKAHTLTLLHSLQENNIHSFGQIAEQEALTLHAMMLTSPHGYFLIHPNTLTVLNEIRTFRAKSNLPVFFTMDAGANVHVLYFEKDKHNVQLFIENQLLRYCAENSCIHSGLGKGPQRL